MSLATARLLGWAFGYGVRVSCTRSVRLQVRVPASIGCATMAKARITKKHLTGWEFYHGFCVGISDTHVYCSSFEEARQRFIFHQQWHVERRRRND